MSEMPERMRRSLLAEWALSASEFVLSKYGIYWIPEQMLSVSALGKE